MTHLERARRIMGAGYLGMVALESGDHRRWIETALQAFELIEGDMSFARDHPEMLDNLIESVTDCKLAPGKHAPAAEALLKRAVALRLRLIGKSA